MDKENQTFIESSDPDLDIFELEKDDGIKYREPRKDDWDENYMLYRDNVIINRLTQRQTINVPLTKYGINTLLKDIDDPPQLYFNELTNDPQKEIYYNEYWKEIRRMNKIAVKDIVDKKQGMLFGRPFKKINIMDGKIRVDLVDPQDIIVHRYTDTINFDECPSLIQTGIYRTLRSIVSNEEYDEEAKEKLRMYMAYEATDLEHDTTFQDATEKFQRLVDLGIDNVLTPQLGETYIELNEAYRYEYEEDENGDPIGDPQIYRMVVACTGGGNIKLCKKPLEEVIGKTKDNYWRNHLPYETWAVDPEATDFWSDGIADIYRPLNKVLNTWISQLVENRTLRNFGMTYYDSSNKEFVPQTYEPRPFGWYAVPGDPNKLLKSVNIPDLSESLDEMQFLISLAEKATAATSANAGTTEDRQVTLGEVQLALANAKERVQSMQLNYTESWKNLGLKYIKMLEAAGSMLDSLEIVKRGRISNKLYRRDVSPENFKSESGYRCEVTTTTDKQSEDIESVQKLRILKTEIPNNEPLNEIYQRKLMEFAGLEPDDIARVEEYNKQMGQSLVTTEDMPQEPQEQMQQAPVGAQPVIPEVPDIAPTA